MPFTPPNTSSIIIEIGPIKFRVSHALLTAFFVDALAWKVGLEVGNVMQDIREMAVLYHKLLALEASDVDATHLIILIHAFVVPKFRAGVSDQPLDELIECLRAARKHKPDLLEGRVALAVSLAHRYFMVFVNDDCEEALSILDEIITCRSPGNSQDEFVAKARRGRDKRGSGAR